MIAQDAGIAAIIKKPEAVTRITPEDGVKIIGSEDLITAQPQNNSPIQWGGSEEDLKAIYDQQNHFDEDVNEFVNNLEDLFKGVANGASFEALALILGGVLLIKIIFD